MFEIEKLHVVTKLEDKQISEDSYFAIFGNNAMKLNKKIFIVNEEEENDDDFLDIYNQHLTEARSVAFKKYLTKLKKDLASHMKSNLIIKQDRYDNFIYQRSRYGYNYDMSDEEKVNNYIETAIHFLDSELTKQSMIQIDELAYFKAQKLFWEDKINDELSKREQEKIDEESGENEE